MRRPRGETLPETGGQGARRGGAETATRSEDGGLLPAAEVREGFVRRQRRG